MELNYFPIIMLGISIIFIVFTLLGIISIFYLTRKTYSISLITSDEGKLTKFVHDKPFLNEIEQYMHLVGLDVSLDHKKIAFSKGSRDWYTIYTPRFRGGGFIADAPLRQSLETRFLNKIKSIPGKKAICSTTTQAMSFVHSISHELTGSEIVTMDFTASSATDHKIILFDLVVNTGRSFYESYQAFVKQKGYAPYACATILFNDYLPKPYREDYELWSYKMFYEKPTTSIYILTVTDLIPYFEEYISEPLLNIRKRLINQEAYSINLGDESASLYHAWVDKNYRIEP